MRRVNDPGLRNSAKVSLESFETFNAGFMELEVLPVGVYELEVGIVKLLEMEDEVMV